MMKRIRAKLRGRAGESLAETLIATLIAALALVMLAGAVGAAAKMITGSRNAIETYETQRTTMESSWTGIMRSELNKTT